MSKIKSDITNRGVREQVAAKRPETANLQDREARLVAAEKVARLGYAFVDLINGTVVWSDEHFRIWGYQPGQVKPGLDLIMQSVHPDDRDRVRRFFQVTGVSDQPVEAEFRIVWPDDSIRFILCRTSVWYNPEGKASQVVATVLDITDRERAEEKVRQLSQAVEQSPISVVITDCGGRIEYVNRKFCEVTGYAFAEVVGQNPRILKSGELPAETYRELWQTITAGETWTGELHNRKKDGRPIWERATVSPMFGTGGKITHFLAILEDITERKRDEKKLRDSEERFRQIAETIQEVFWMADPQIGRMLYISPGYEKIWGRSCVSLYNDPRSFLDAVHPDDRERVVNALAVEKKGEPFDHEYRIVRPDGALRWIWDRGFPVGIPTGPVTHYAGIAQDITERKRAEEQIQEQAELLHLASDAILVRDLGDRIRYWNQSAERIFGWTAQEAVGQNAGQLLHRDGAQYGSAKKQVLEKGAWNGEMTAWAKRGRELLVEVRWTLVRDLHGNPKSILSVNSDITEKKKLETQFLRAQRMESLGTLAGGIAHDLNNVLAPMLMSAQLLREKITDPEILLLLDALEANARRGASLVKQVLAFGRGVKGERVPVQPRVLVREVEQMVREAFPKSVQFAFQSPRDLWTTIGDATQIHQVLLNLCVNARDAMPDGGKLSIAMENVVLEEVPVGISPEIRPGAYVCISVTDTGAGIAPEIMDKIYDPFFTTKTPDHGTGLGLSTSLGIVRSHGGFINCYSEVGQGTTFKVYLPASVAPELKTPVTARQSKLPRGRNELVLIVDDEEAIRKVVKKTLERFGYRVLLVANGSEAVALYNSRQNEINAVVTDMMMPVMDGLATINALRAINPEIKIIGSSGFASSGGKAKAADAGLKHFLPKPYAAEALLLMLDEVLHQNP